MKIFLPFGLTIIDYFNDSLPDPDQIDPKHTFPVQNPNYAIERSLLNPIDCINIDDDLTGKTIGVTVNDTTRPVPNSLLLPPLLEYFHQRNAKEKNIAFFIACGTHKQILKEENEQIFPKEIIHNYSIQRHNCDDFNNLEDLGFTSRNTPVNINRDYYQRDVKVVIGNIEPHHFMGYSGGAKSAAIGLASRETIRVNHSHLMESDSFIGNYSTNPTRLDLEEIGDKISINAALNVVMNSERQIVKVLWGSPRMVMQKGIRISRLVCQKRVGKQYDLVITSAGGYPKDINLYQAQKAITHVSRIAKVNGTIILVAECSQGLGSEEFEDYLGQFRSVAELIHHFKRSKFEIGPHKAYQLAIQALRNRIIVVSSIKPSIISKTRMEYASTLKDAMEMAIKPGFPPTIAVVPHATNTMFY